jgi:hypothetical protein
MTQVSALCSPACLRPDSSSRHYPLLTARRADDSGQDERDGHLAEVGPC